MKRKVVVQWLIKANDDLKTSEILLKSEDIPTGAVCFHAQQAVEKFLKAYLTNIDVRTGKTHDIAKLLNMCIQHDKDFEYIVKANRLEKVEKISQGQTLAFLQELSEVVASSENCCLVVTLPASILERYDEEAERALHQLQKVLGRVEAVYTPVEGIELYEIIRKRLFEELGSEEVRKNVAQSYFDFYNRLGSDVPSEVREPEYREKIERAYPFHPELIDVLYERWGSFPTFQRTRGVLRLLAEIVGQTPTTEVVGLSLATKG